MCGGGVSPGDTFLPRFSEQQLWELVVRAGLASSPQVWFAALTMWVGLRTGPRASLPLSRKPA